MILLSVLLAVNGYATWYDNGPGLYAAAGPSLREALGSGWRGQTVEVTSGGRTVSVVLSDWCACGERSGEPTVLDLSPAAFRALAPLSRGVIKVSVGGSQPAIPAPPATDVGPVPGLGTTPYWRIPF